MILKNGKRIDGCTDTLPVGTVQPFLGLTPPLGYLVCQGQLISKVEYPELYNICKSAFGTETETHFYLPDLRGKTIAGYDSDNVSMNSIGKILGEEKHRHLTPLSWYGNDGKYYFGTTNFYGNKTVDYQDLYGTEVTVRGSYPSTSTNRLNYYTDYQSNYQPTITMNWIVKAAMLIPEYFKVDNTLTSTSTSNALSAAQGKILDGKITSVEAKINQIGQNNSSVKFTDFSSTTNYKTKEGYNTIIVKNGWCTVRCYLNVVSPATSQVPILKVPVPLIISSGYPHWEFHNWEDAPSGIPLIVVVTEDGQLNLRKGVAGVNYFINISYPISE